MPTTMKQTPRQIEKIEITKTRPGYAEGAVLFRDSVDMNWVSRLGRGGEWTTVLRVPGMDVPLIDPPRTFALARDLRKLRKEGVIK